MCKNFPWSRNCNRLILPASDGRHQATEQFKLSGFIRLQTEISLLLNGMLMMCFLLLLCFSPFSHFNYFSFFQSPPPPGSASAQMNLTPVHNLFSYLVVFHSSSCPPPFLCPPEAPFHSLPSFFMLLMLSPPDLSMEVCFKWFSWFSPSVSGSFCCHIFLEAVLHKIKVRKNYFLVLEKKISCLAEVVFWGSL